MLTTSQALSLNPKYAHAYNNRGVAWTTKGEYGKAIADYSQAVSLDPNYAYAYNNRGHAWENEGKYDEAVADYNEAIRLDPKYAEARDSLAWLCATCPNKKYRDGKRAVENATKAYQLDSGKSWSSIATLAAACAENGDFDKAKEWQAKAITLVATDKAAKDSDKQEMHNRLELYKQGKSYHEEPKKK